MNQNSRENIYSLVGFKKVFRFTFQQTIKNKSFLILAIVMILMMGLMKPLMYLMDKSNRATSERMSSVLSEVKAEKLKDAETSAVITLSEEVRRMQDMMRMYGMNSAQVPGGEGQTLVLNTSNALVQYVLANPDGENTELFCHQIYDLALLAHMPLGAEEMTKFVARSNKIMELLAK